MNAAAGNTGATVPIFVVASEDGKFLYVLESGTGGLAAFRVDGYNLHPLFNNTGLPLTVQGIAGR